MLGGSLKGFCLRFPFSNNQVSGFMCFLPPNDGPGGCSARFEYVMRGRRLSSTPLASDERSAHECRSSILVYIYALAPKVLCAYRENDEMSINPRQSVHGRRNRHAAEWQWGKAPQVLSGTQLRRFFKLKYEYRVPP